MKNSIVFIPAFTEEVTTDVIDQTSRQLLRKNYVVIFHAGIYGKKKFAFRAKEKQYFILDYYSALDAVYYYTFLAHFYKNIILFFESICLSVFLLLRIRSFFSVKKILWTFNLNSYFIFEKIFPFFDLTLYDCVDFNAETNSHSFIREKQLIQQVDIFTVNSKTLLKLHKQNRSDVKLVPQGFRLETFFRKPIDKIKQCKNIGYVGGINFRIDYDLLLNVIPHFPTINFIFCGPVGDFPQEFMFKQQLVVKLKKLKNVYFLGSVDKEHIPEVISSFDIAIIPYDATIPFNTNSYPMKTMEYFYMGKPIICTEIYELESFPQFIKVAKTPQDWETAIVDLMSGEWTSSAQNSERAIAIENSWLNKITKIEQAINYKLSKK